MTSLLPSSSIDEPVAHFEQLMGERQTWQWRGYQIPFVRMGTGQPLVLLHGFGASIGHWRKNIPVLAAAGYQVFALDLLGFGAADKPVIEYSMELWRDLVQDFCQANVPAPAIFVGNSIGGLLSLMLLADCPEVARGGILLNPAGGLNHRPEELNWLLRVILGNFGKLAGSPLIGGFLFNWVRRKANIRRSLSQIYRNRAAIDEALIELLHRPSCDPGAQQVFGAILSAPAGPRPEELLPKVNLPILVLWGEADPWTPISAAQTYRQFNTPDRPIEIYPIADTGHCPHDDRPEAVNAQIIAWLKLQGV